MTTEKCTIQHCQKVAMAIELLSNNRCIEAALMLTYAGIDQMAWLSSSNEITGGKEFETWVEEYINPVVNLGCSPKDLWAARCGLIHTGAPESRDFYKSDAKKIYYYTGKAEQPKKIAPHTSTSMERR